MPNIYIANKSFLGNQPKKSMIADVTSTSTTNHNKLSPFNIGPVDLPETHLKFKKLENAYQRSKLYRSMADENDLPTKEFWDWRKAGSNLNRGFKRQKDFNGNYLEKQDLIGTVVGDENSFQILEYQQSKKNFQLPMYAQTYNDSTEFNQFMEEIDDAVKSDRDIYLLDYDAPRIPIKTTNNQFKNLLENDNTLGHAQIMKQLILANYARCNPQILELMGFEKTSKKGAN